MNITITIGVTPELQKALQGLTALLGNTSVSTNGQQNQVQTTPVQQAPTAPLQLGSVTPMQQAPTVPIQAPFAQNQAPIQQAPVQQTPPTAVPTSAPTYTMGQLAVAATQLVDAGKREQLVQLLQSFGTPALMQLPKEQYGAFATKLREMGAKI